ncbi:DNA polymerase III subunit delta' [Thiocapsa imhoffii]|uniref:DNA polymerase III subunit delta' n=1 Tax=Thiocapsa imhoffii TaxID=382777 RepID=A0A9X1B8Z1_9GAMM|nr:DNA polymerase III subunit delta' C-terminal domain-containing protein [Thiocapsa imhoffii]MBK1645302.1 DNA polymerase III subunit delta' [Thiocapsa imhoffii]
MTSDGCEGLPRDRALPWMTAQWQRLLASRQAGRLAHGLLVSGLPGLGKRHLVDLFARSLLCHTPTAAGFACQRCPDCVLVAAHNHPDLLRIGPDSEAKSSDISIDTVRALVDRGALTPSRGAWKVTILDPADHLTAAASNALLKTLEEPPGVALIVLVTEYPSRLPATIRSRCLQLKIPLPPSELALQWLVEQVEDGSAPLRLALAHGAPLRALASFDANLLQARRERLDGFFALLRGTRDPLGEAAAWQALGPPLALEWLAGWFTDLLRLKASECAPHLDNPDQRASFAALARTLDANAAHRVLQRTLRGRALVETRVNPQLTLEALAIACRGLGAAPHA